MPLDPSVLVYGLIPWYRMGELLTIACFLGCLMSVYAIYFGDNRAADGTCDTTNDRRNDEYIFQVAEKTLRKVWLYPIQWTNSMRQISGTWSWE